MRIKNYTLIFTLILCECNITANSQNNMTVTDCQGNKYPIVQIGEQYWMAENLRCTKYDTENNLSYQKIPQDKKWKKEQPHCMDISVPTGDLLIDTNLTKEQISKLGVLYNRAAALGLQSNSDEIDDDNIIQGICPNGWHIPTTMDTNTLRDYITGSKKSNISVGGKLKSKSGWGTDDDGDDLFGFQALPAGNYNYKNKELYIGYWTEFITSPQGTIKIQSSDSIFPRIPNFDTQSSLDDDLYSVRCVKNVTLTDCQGRSYSVANIGGKYWMTEDLKCTKYDTNSERKGETLAQIDSTSYAPYCMDGYNYFLKNEDTTAYSSRGTTASKLRTLKREYEQALRDDKMFYNWAAAVGITTSNDVINLTDMSGGKRQGICPNGWHIPTREEWESYATATMKKKEPVSNSKYYKFNDLHSSKSYWTSNPLKNYGAYKCVLINTNDESTILIEECDFKDEPLRVRCVKD